MENNLLIHGDNLEVMKYLLEHGYKGMIDLIYIDPPYFTNKDYYYTDKQTKKKVLAYSDKWDDLQSYLTFLKERLILMKELLSEKGSIYVHLDWHASHYVKVIMDEIFGYDNFRNEIVWSYRTGGGANNTYGFSKKHDIILFYSKSNIVKFKKLKERIYYEKIFFSQQKDEYGKYYADVFLRDVLEDDVNLVFDGKLSKISVKPLINVSKERVGFYTQKSEGLLQILIMTTTDPNDIVADFFCGSGTTLAVAEKLKRKWIGVDNSDVAIEVTKKRLKDADYKFVSMNDLIVNKWSEFFIFEQ